MNILLAHDTCILGGHTSFMLDLAAGLQARGHRVLCHFHEDEGYLPAFASRVETRCGSPAQLAALLRQEPFDVVHGDSCMMDLGAVLRAARFSGRRVITRHAVNAPAGWTSHRCDAYVAVSPSSAREMQPLTDLQVTCIPNGVDTVLFQPSAAAASPRRIIAWCGRSLDRFKNLDLLLRAAALLDPERYEVHVADGDAAAPPAGLPDIITSWRRYARTELPQFFARVAASGGALLHTAHVETQGLALLEAMACGCPVFARNATGVVDVLGDELRDWLYPAVDENAAAEAVVRFAEARLNDPLLEERRSQAVARVRREFSREAMVDAYAALYRDPGAALCGSRTEPAQRLWEWAEATETAGGGARDVLFAARGAAALDPTLPLSPKRTVALARWLSRSRWGGARSAVQFAGDAWREGRIIESLKWTGRALRLHPGALLQVGG